MVEQFPHLTNISAPEKHVGNGDNKGNQNEREGGDQEQDALDAIFAFRSVETYLERSAVCCCDLRCFIRHGRYLIQFGLLFAPAGQA